MAKKKSITNYECDACQGGIVKVSITETRETISFRVGDCNKCKKPHGINSVSNLKEIK